MHAPVLPTAYRLFEAHVDTRFNPVRPVDSDATASMAFEETA